VGVVCPPRRLVIWPSPGTMEVEWGAVASGVGVFGSEPNSSTAFSHCLAMNRSGFRIYELRRNTECAYV